MVVVRFVFISHFFEVTSLTRNFGLNSDLTAALRHFSLSCLAGSHTSLRHLWRRLSFSSSAWFRVLSALGMAFFLPRGCGHANAPRCLGHFSLPLTDGLKVHSWPCVSFRLTLPFGHVPFLQCLLHFFIPGSVWCRTLGLSYISLC